MGGYIQQSTQAVPMNSSWRFGGKSDRGEEEVTSMQIPMITDVDRVEAEDQDSTALVGERKVGGRELAFYAPERAKNLAKSPLLRELTNLIGK